MIDHWKDQIRTPKFGIKGGQRLGAPIEEMRLLDWSRVIETNLTGTFLCAQAVGKVMLGNRRGKIINISSVAGLRGAPAEILQATAYHASKGAVISFTRDLACKLGSLQGEDVG